VPSFNGRTSSVAASSGAEELWRYVSIIVKGGPGGSSGSKSRAIHFRVILVSPMMIVAKDVTAANVRHLQKSEKSMPAAPPTCRS